MPGWAAALLTSTAGLLLALAVMNLLVTAGVFKVQAIEAAKPDFVILRRWSLWSKPGLHWYLQRKRDHRCLMYGASGGFVAAIPLALYHQSVSVAIVTPIITAMVYEALNLLGLDYVARQADSYAPFAVQVPEKLAPRKNRIRAALDGAAYLEHVSITAAVGVVYLLSLSSNEDDRFGPSPGVLALVVKILGTALSIALPALLVRAWWNRKFIVARTQMAIGAALLTQTNGEPRSYEIQPPIRIADASHDVRRRLAVAAKLLSGTARRLANAQSIVPAIHPLAIILWGVSDRIIHYLGTPDSLMREIPADIIALLRKISAVMAGPYRADTYKELITDSSLFGADWSTRMGGARSRATARFVASMEHLERAKTGAVAVAIILAVLGLAVLLAIGQVDIKAAVNRILDKT